MNQHLVPCPHCGADIAAQANFCRHCGSSDADGWKDEWEDDADDDFDYEEFVQDNFSPRATNTQTSVIWRVTAIVIMIALALILYRTAVRLF